MSEKVIRNLGIALIAIIALYAFMRWQQNRSFEPAKPKGFNFKKITKKNTKKISVKSTKANYVLVNRGTKWQLNGIDVSNTEIDSLFDGLKEINILNLAATKKSKLTTLEVDDNNGKLVTFYSNKKKISFIIGKTGVDGNSFYIKLPKKSKAYTASGNLGTVFAKEVDGWYDKEVLNLSQDDIKKISFSYEGEFFELSKKKKAQWYLKEEGLKEKADNDKVETLLGSLSMLSASNIVSPAKNIDFSGSEAITIKGKKGKQLAKLSIKSKGKKEYYLKSSTKKLTYIIDEMTAKNIRKKAKDLK